MQRANPERCRRCGRSCEPKDVAVACRGVLGVFVARHDQHSAGRGVPRSCMSQPISRHKKLLTSCPRFCVDLPCFAVCGRRVFYTVCLLCWIVFNDYDNKIKWVYFFARICISEGSSSVLKTTLDRWSIWWSNCCRSRTGPFFIDGKLLAPLAKLLLRAFGPRHPG